MNRLFEELTPVVALEKDSIGGASKTTGKIGLGEYRRVLFYALLEADAGNFAIKADGPEDVSIKAVKQKGTDGDTEDMADAYDLEAGQYAREIVIENCDDWDDDDTVTINGVVFTKKATGDNEENEFSDGSELETQINAAIEGVTADDSTNDVTVTVDDPTDYMTVEASITSDTSDTRVSVLEASAIAEVHVAELGEGFDHVYLNFDDTDAGTVNATVVAVMGNTYHQPVKQPSALIL